MSQRDELPEPDSHKLWRRWLQAANEALSALRGSQCRCLGDVGPPCNTLRMVVGPDRKANVAISLVYCGKVAGPSAWLTRNLEIRWKHGGARGNHITQMPGSIVVLDREVGFSVEADLLMWARDVDTLNDHAWKLWRPSVDDSR